MSLRNPFPLGGKYKWKDQGWAKIQNKLARTFELQVVAGVVGSMANQQHEDSDLTVGEVATVNEFGTQDGHVPERSFMRDVTRNHRSEFGGQSTKAMRSMVFGGMSADHALRSIGEWAVQKIRDNIERGVPPPNAPATIEKKGHGNTLQETATLWLAISYEIVSAMGRSLFVGEDL